MEDMITFSQIDEAIKSSVSDYLLTATNEGTGEVINSSTRVSWPNGKSTQINWTGSKNLVNDEINEKLNRFDKSIPISASNLYNLLVDCLRSACRVWYQKYSYYNGNSSSSIESYTYRGIMGTGGTSENKGYHVTENTYKENNQCPSDIASGELIKRSPILNFIDSLISYNQSLESTIDHGIINSCYSNCHSSCVSSRGRR